MKLLHILAWYIFFPVVFGNVEKVIFTAPPSTILPADASIDNLLLTSLNPLHLSVRTYLNATFPSIAKPKGTESWLLLEGLNPGQRYEARICWLATQPTAFWLYVHSVSATFDTPLLISALSDYAYARHHSLSSAQRQSLQSRRLHTRDDTSSSSSSSVLLLQIYAAADYYSTNKTLMRNVPPVLVDIILDPFILNIFPQSLLPTAAYIAIIAVSGWFLSAWTAKQLCKVASDGQSLEDNESSSKLESRKSK